jgi:hypothetical protein
MLKVLPMACRSTVTLGTSAWSYAAIPLIYIFMVIIRTGCIGAFNVSFFAWIRERECWAAWHLDCERLQLYYVPRIAPALQASAYQRFFLRGGRVCAAPFPLSYLPTLSTKGETGINVSLVCLLQALIH